MTHTICMCDVPNLWEDNKGKKTNMCKDCGGRLPEPGTDPRREIGSLLIQVQGVMHSLDFKSEREQAEFAAHMSKTLGESWRQSLLTWRANETQKAIDAAKAA